MAADTRLVADVGGTNTRLAVYHRASNSLDSVAQYTNRDYKSLAAIIEDWRSKLATPMPTQACIAIAAPPFPGEVAMVNIDWSFSPEALAAQFDFKQFRCLNDFEANAFALPHLKPADLNVLQARGANSRGAVCVIGPGTGLGGATLRFSDGKPEAIAAEPGFIGLSPESDMEIALFQHLLADYGRIYAELLLSGDGLVRLYRGIAELEGAQVLPLKPADVSTLALRAEDPGCLRALNTFCALLGAACGDFALANGGYGGVFIAGGIVPRIAEFLHRSPFLSRFHNKGPAAKYMHAMPVSIITHSNPGLIGAAHAPID